MEELMDAREALKLSLEGSVHDTTENLKKIISSINKAADEGKFSCIVKCDSEIDRHILKYLKQKGYEVSYGELVFMCSTSKIYNEIKIRW